MGSTKQEMQALYQQYLAAGSMEYVWDLLFFLCKELIPGYLDEITGEYATPAGYMVDEKEAEEFDKAFPYKKKRS